MRRLWMEARGVPPSEQGRVSQLEQPASMEHVSVRVHPVSVFAYRSAVTPAVVQDVCGRLLDRAKKAEIEAERLVLVEFGLCLTEIIKTMFK